jgi:hypothetical protein
MDEMSVVFSKGNAVALEEMQVIVAGVTGNLAAYKVQAAEFAPVTASVGAFADAQSVAVTPCDADERHDRGAQRGAGRGRGVDQTVCHAHQV